MGVTYDAGALIAGARGDRRMWALHAGFLLEEVLPTVPSVVLAQAWRGGPRQTNLHRLLVACDVDELSVDGAKRSGELLAHAGRADVVDAVVVEGALRRGDAVVTSDPADLRRLAAALGEDLALEVV